MGTLSNALTNLKQWDKATGLEEVKEISSLLLRQVFKQIPGVSAIGALVAGSWVASTFTTSPVKATLARWGFIRGGSRVVSHPTYTFLSVVLPILVAAVTAYVVQKALKMIREQQMQRDIWKVLQLGKDIQELVQARLSILEKAREADLISPSEFLTKKANLYASYSRIVPSRIKKILFDKVAG